MTHRPRVAILGVYHETNTFSPLRTGLDAFARRWYRGSELQEQFEGTRTMAGGFFDGARAAGLEPIPVFATFATPSGTVLPEAFAAIRSAMRAALREVEDIDGVLFEVHGDLFVEGERDAEASLVHLVREELPGRPIAIALDMHANLAAPRLGDVEIVIGYRTNPHVDTYERGADAAAMLAPLLHGSPTPHRAHRGLALVAAPAAQRTEDEPLRSLWALADAIEARPGILNATVHGGYAYADTEFTGMGFQVTAVTEAADAAERAADELLALAVRLAPRFQRDLPETADAVRLAVAAPGVQVIADTGDNINGGSPGDTTWLAREAVRHPGRRFLGTIADPDALGRLRAAGEGARLRLELGGWASPRSGEPLDLEVEVLRLTDGVFTNAGPMSTGATVSMGGAAWIRSGGLDLVVQGEARQPNDPNLFASLGIDVAGYDVLLLKGAAALRAAWTPIVDGFIDAGTRGETDSVLSRLEYRRSHPRLP